jgi:hypothetical protein
MSLLTVPFLVRQPRRIPRKRSLVQPNDWSPAFVSQHHAYHVKPTRRRPIDSHLSNVSSRHRSNVALLRRVHRDLRRHQSLLRVRLHLDKAQHAFIPADDVNLSVVAGRAIVLRHDAITQAAKIEVGFHFAASCRVKVTGRRPTKTLGCRAQKAGHPSNQPEHTLSPDGVSAFGTVCDLCLRFSDVHHSPRVLLAPGSSYTLSVANQRYQTSQSIAGPRVIRSVVCPQPAKVQQGSCKGAMG